MDCILKIQIHESIAPLLRGIGLTVVLLGTVLAAVQTKEQGTMKGQAAAADSSTKPGGVTFTNRLADQPPDRLTQEVEELRETIQHENTVEEVLENPWFGSLGMVGSGIAAASFYVEWMCKRTKRVNPSSGTGN